MRSIMTYGNKTRHIQNKVITGNRGTKGTRKT